MSDVTLSGNDVLRGDLKLPYAGAWTAELDLDADSAPTGSVSLSFLGRTFVGSVVADPTDPSSILSGDSGGFYRCRVVGGAGGLGIPIAPQECPQGAIVQQVLSAILSAGGEAAAQDIDPVLLGRALPQWSFTQGTVGDALAALVEYLRVAWRIRADGLVWIGTPSPATTAPPDYIVADVAPESGQASWDLNEVSVEPDQVIDGLTIRQVVYTWQPASLRALVTFAPGPVNALFSLFVLWLRRVNLDYFRNVPGRIASQNGDGTVQFQPDDSEYAPMRRVGIRLGLPDCSVQVSAGSRAVAAWEAAAPAGPVLASFGKSTATKIKLGVSAGTQPTIKGTDFRTAQAAMDSTLATKFQAAAVALASAGTSADLLMVAPAAAAEILLAGQALGNLTGVAKAVNDFETAAASHNNFVTSIVEVG